MLKTVFKMFAWHNRLIRFSSVSTQLYSRTRSRPSHHWQYYDVLEPNK